MLRQRWWQVNVLARIAWRNIWRSPRRTWITVSAMALGVALCMACVAWIDGMFMDGFDLLVRQTIGHVQVQHPAYPKHRALYDTIPDAETLLERLDRLPDVQAVSGRVLGYSLLAVRDQAAGAQLIGVVPEREAATSSIDTKVESGGHWLGGEPRKEILLGFGLAESLKAKLGDEVVVVTQAADGSLGNDLFHVTGVIKTGSVARDRAGAYVHRTDLQQLLALPDQLHEIALIARDEDRIPALASEVRSALADRRVLVRTWDEVNPVAKQLISFQDSFMFVMLFLVYAVAALGILNTMLMSVFERTKELGVMRALGLRPVQTMLLVVLESAAMALVAGALGLGLGLLFDGYLVKYGIDLSNLMGSFSFGGISFSPVMYGRIRLSAVVTTVVGLFGIAILASLWPAFRAARLKPVEAMRQE